MLQDFRDLSCIFGCEDTFLLFTQPSFQLLQKVPQSRQQPHWGPSCQQSLTDKKIEFNLQYTCLVYLFDTVTVTWVTDVGA